MPRALANMWNAEAANWAASGRAAWANPVPGWGCAPGWRGWAPIRWVLHRFDWPDQEGSDFHLPHGEMLALLRRTGFEVQALHELRAPDGPADERRFFVLRGWARRWPCEEVWVARRPPG